MTSNPSASDEEAERSADADALTRSMRELASQIILKTSSLDRGSSHRLEVALRETLSGLVAFRKKYPRHGVDLARMADLSGSTDIFESKDDSPLTLARLAVLQDALWLVGHQLGGHATSERKALTALFGSLDDYAKARTEMLEEGRPSTRSKGKKTSKLD